MRCPLSRWLAAASITLWVMLTAGPVIAAGGHTTGSYTEPLKCSLAVSLGCALPRFRNQSDCFRESLFLGHPFRVVSPAVI
ncbi:MAG TPA: hypothetical protein VNH84_12425, partial [Candidatus Saccharimonadales bacterium]|nr:hypothetical protein [Candidatus Saccharimonadales bacterium]